MNSPTITLNKGGTDERTVKLDSLCIPDLWHVAQRMCDARDRGIVLEVWHLCHDLLEHAKPDWPITTQETT